MDSTRNRFAALMGIDWSEKEQVISLQDTRTGAVELQWLEHTPEAIGHWARALRERFGGEPIAVAVEQTRGALIYALLQYEFLVLYSINPKALASYRESFRLSGAKDDPTDADLLRDYLQQHRDRLRAWQPDPVQLRALRLLVEQRRRWVDDCKRWSLRLRSRLLEYFPQAVSDLGGASSPQLWQFLLRWPTLQKAQRSADHTLERFFGKLGCRHHTIQARIQTIRQSVPLTTDEAVLRVHPLLVQGLCRQLLQARETIGQLEQQIAPLFESHPDQHLFASLPGAGPQRAPRLLVAFGEDRQRWTSRTLSCFSGIAPVTRQSGQTRWVHHRFVCPKYLKQTFHEFAAGSIPHSLWASAFYQWQRQQGTKHHAAVRALAFKWIRIITRCWQDRVPYDEQHYLEALRRAGSPLWEYIQHQVPDVGKPLT
jgi:transposase